MPTIRARAIALALEGKRPVEIAATLGVQRPVVVATLCEARRAGVPVPHYRRGPIPARRPEQPPRAPTMAERALAMAREEPTPSLRDIAARLGTSRASVTEALRRARHRGEQVPEFSGGRPRRATR